MGTFYKNNWTFGEVLPKLLTLKVPFLLDLRLDSASPVHQSNQSNSIDIPPFNKKFTDRFASKK